MLRAAKYLLGSPGANGFGSKSTAEDVCPDLGCITAIITGALQFAAPAEPIGLPFWPD
jgi:retinol dehydrogenase-12